MTPVMNGKRKIMKDKDGFLIKCKNCEWMIINDWEDHDFVCRQFGDRMIGYHMCYGDEHCRYYEPDKKESDDG